MSFTPLMKECIVLLTDASSAFIGSTAALVLVATATCLVINMHLRKGQWRGAAADVELNASLGRIEHLMTRPGSVAVSCDPAYAEIKARLGKLENMMTCVMGAVDKYPRSQCLSCNKLETLIAQLIDATEKHKPSQAVASKANSLSPRLQRWAQSSSDVVNYTTQPPLPVPGSTPYQHRQRGPQHDFTKGMSTSFGPTHSGRLPSDSQRKTQSCRRSCESGRSSNSVLTSPEFDKRWPMLNSPAAAVAQPAVLSEGRVNLDLAMAGSIPSDSFHKSSGLPLYKKCTVDEALQLLNTSPGKSWPNYFSLHMWSTR